MYKQTTRGSYRIDIIFPAPIGRIARASGMHTQEGFERVEQTLRRAYEAGNIELLLQFKRGAVTVADLLQAAQRGSVALAALEYHPFWRAVESLLGPAANATKLPPTRHRYRTSLTRLERRRVIRADGSFFDLASVDWAAVKDAWGNSPADWMHLRRAVSWVLSQHFSDPRHPFAQRVRALIPTVTEPRRSFPAVGWRQ